MKIPSASFLRRVLIDRGRKESVGSGLGRTGLGWKRESSLSTADGTGALRTAFGAKARLLPLRSAGTASMRRLLGSCLGFVCSCCSPFDFAHATVRANGV
jgi:hypothetical protein